MLVVLAIFKNESHILDEWLTHYKSLGVSHFFLINNGSTDDWKVSLKRHQSYTTVYTLMEKFSQELHYRKVMNDIRKNIVYEWCLVVDLDEFLFPAEETISLLDYCKKIMPSTGNVAQVLIPWKVFGSSGHISQPKSVRTEFTACRPLVSKTTKSMFRIDCLKTGVMVHGQNVKGTTLRVNDLHLYHYVLQSYEWFSNVKMKRGDVAHSQFDTIRNHKYFDEYDSGCTSKDTLLQDRVLKGLYI